MSDEPKGQGGLTRAERITLAVTRFINETPRAKRLQQAWLTNVNQTWVRYVIGRRVFTENIEWLLSPPSDRGVVFCLNHRSYFDAYIAMFALYESGAAWPQKMYFPVRSNFFYENAVGAAVNLLIGGGALYPPIFRETRKSELNRDALRRLAGFLEESGSLVGLHPEGTRGKGDDPYQLLPAQPGIGQIVLQSRPVVVPAFINGLSNSYARDISSTFHPHVRRENPVIVVYGEALDYEDLAAQKPRAALYKKMSDRIRDRIIQLGQREKVLRARCASGEIGEDHPGWVTNHALRE